MNARIRIGIGCKEAGGYGPPLAVAAGLAVASLLLSACANDSAPATGTWGVAEEGKPQLVLEEDGSLTGTDGCNRLMGTWEEGDGSSVTFVNVASTKMSCMGVDEWLSGLDSAEVDGETLRVVDRDGTEIGTLTRQQGD